MPNKRGYKKRGSALKTSPPATSPRRTKTPAPTQTLTPVRRVGRPPSKLRSPASPVQRSSLPTVSPKPGEKLQQSCNHTQQLWSDVNCGTAAAEATKPRQMHDSPEHSTSLHDSSDQEINIQDHIYRPQSQHSVSEDDAIHANPTPTAAMPPDSHPQEDANNSQNRPKKLSKREVKALLKQPKRARTILDESVVAEMDQLATRFEVDCKINVAGVIRRPIPVAEPIDSNTSPLSAPSVPVSPPAPSVVRGGRGRGRGRRGSAAAAASLRRGGGKAGSFASLTPAPTRTPRTASWSPLCLPARASYEAPLHKSPAPRLKFLSASCVKNFLAKVESILSRSHSQQSRLLPTHSLDANGFDFSHKQEPAPLTTYPSLPPTAPAAEQSYYQHQQQKPAYHHHHHHHHHHNEMPEEQHPMRKAEAYPSNYAPHSPPPPQPPPSTAPVVPGPPDSLQVGETSSAVSIVRHVRIGRPPKRGGQRRGRGRPRILNLPSDDALRAAVAEAGAESERAKWHQYEGVDQPRSYHPAGDSGDLRGASPQKPPSPATEAITTGGASGAPDCLTMQHLAKPGKPGRPRGSLGARRELRGLVTWAAMMAAEEQAAQQKQHRRHSSLEEEDADSSFSAEPARKPTGLSPLSLQIVGMEDDLTATAADGSGLSDPSRTTRRTRRASLGTASGGSSVGATRGGHVSGRRASETGSSVSVVDAGDQSLKDGLQPNASSWASDQADTSSLLPFSPSPLHVAASDATMDSTVPERQQNNSASNGEVGLPTNASEEDQVQPPVRPLHRGRGGGGGGGRGRKRKYQRGIGRPSEQNIPPSPPPPPTPSQSDLSMPTAFPPFVAGNGASSDDNNGDKCVSGSPLKSTAADDEDSSSSGARRLDPAASGGGSGGPILPPRKRYKANVDSSDEQRPSTSPQPTSRSPLSPSMDGGDLSSPSPPSNPAQPNLSDLCGGYLAPVGSAGVRSSLESDSSPFGVRGGTRGRGGLRGRRKGRGGRRSLHQPFETHQDAKAAADNAATSVVDTTPSRPKREAAALGFASLVASSLNSSPIQYDQSESSIKPSQQTPVDHHHQNSPSLTTSETVDPATTPTTPVGTTLASVRTPSQKSWRGGGTPPVGRGRGLRGRPPKRPIAATPTVLFPPPLLAATASAAATAAADGTMQTKIDSSFSSETSATTATSINDSPPAQSATTPTAASAVTDAPVSAPSEAELSGAGLQPSPPVSTEASVVTSEGLPVLTGKRKIGGGGKRGRRPTAATQVSSPPTKRRAVEDTVPLPPSSVNGSSATAPTTKTPPPPPPASSASGFGTDELNHACRDLRLFLLRTHARSEHRLRRDRERRSKATANVDDTVGSTKRLLTGTVERLPSRNLIFPFGSLTRKLLDESEEKAGLNADLVPTGGVQALLATLLDRLLNHPDLEPNGTGARLVAPLLSTPDPLRHPDFYRYACSTGALASLETALGLPKGIGHSLQADILLTVSPCYCFTNGYAGQRSVPAPFQHLSPEYPPICLRSLLHSVLNGKLLLTGDADSSPSATTATAFLRLDLAFDLLMRLWEAYAGRRSWLGRRLLQIRGAYTRLRTEQTAEDSSIPLPHLTPGSASAANKIQGASPGGGPLKKKVDRRTLERGAEVIRCLCGFRVEAGHVMVQCDCCTTWQHLPCVWWALSICLEPSLAAPRSTPASQLANWLPHQPPHDPGFEPEEGAAAADSAGRRARCRAALLAALQTGGISLPAHSGGGNCGSAGSATAPDCAYFCPTCLELDGLTKDYPRTLAVALAQNDVAKVFPETTPESTAGVTYEYWSLASPDGGDQLLTDEFALVHRDDFQHAVERGSAVAATAAGTTAETGEETNKLRLASDVVVLRIYRLWKDSSGKSWMEGGAFLRPYDLLKGAPPQTTALVNSQLWHARELVYDEASRVVLPLSAWRGRCSVLSPTVYRQGRLMDLPALILPSSTAEVEETDAHPLVFLCDRLFNRGEGDSLSFQEIAPAYLKVNMKPYAFLRHTESSALRAAIVRQLRAEDLRTLDSSTAFGAVLSVNLDGLYSQSRERRQKGRPLSPRRTHELVFSLSEKITLDAALGRLSSQSRKQHATTTDSRIFTHTNRKSCLPAKLGDPTIGHPNLPAGASDALSSSAGPTPELSSTSALLLTEGTEPTTPATIHATADSAVIPSTKRSGKSKAGSGKIRDQDLLKDAKTLTFSELREKIAAQEGLSAKTAAPSPRRKVVGKQHPVSTVKSSLKHTSAAAAPTDSTSQPDLGPPRSPLFVETTTPAVTDLTKKPQFSPISPATSPLSPDPTSSAIAIITDTLQQQQQRLPENHKSPPPSSQASEDLHPTAPSTVVESTFPGAPRLLSSSEQIEPDKPTEETVSELSDVELSSKAATGSTVIATATETACHNTASSEVMLATPSRLKPIPLKVNQALVMVSSSEEENFETCDELFPIPEPQLVAIQEEENDDFAEDGDVQSSCVHLSAGVTLSTTESVSLVTCVPAISHRAEASRIPCGVKTLESSPQLEMLEGLDATEVNEEFAQWTVCSPAGADSHLNPFSTVCEMVLNSPFSTTAVAPMSLSGVPSPAEATSTVVSSLSDFVTESADAIVYTCPLASLVAPGCRVSPPNGQQNQPLRPLISPALTYQPISPDSSDESPRRTHASVQPPPHSEIPNAVGDDSVQSDGNRLSTTAATDEEKRQRHSVSRSSPSGVWSPAQSRDHRDRRRHSHHRYHHHHHRDRDHHRRSSSNRSRSNSEHQQPSEHHQHRHYHHRQHRHSDCSSVDSEQRERQRSRSQSDHRHSRHERYPEAKDAAASVAAAENTSRPNSHHRRRKGHSPKRIVFRRYEDGTSGTATRDSAVTAPVPQEGVLDLSTSSSSTLAPESNGGEVSSGGSSNN